MSILWAGGEDLNFPNGGGVGSLGSSNPNGFRAGYARVSLYATSSTLCKSTVLPGGAVTSAWLHCRIANEFNFPGSTSTGIVGFGLSGTSKGLFFGYGSATGKAAILTYDGSAWTVLASESGSSATIVFHALQRLDMQVISYGASATVNVYLNGVLLVTFTGDVTVSGVSNFDSVYYSNNGNFSLSEIIVADEDTRAFAGLATMAPTAAGSTDDWTGAYTDVNPTSINDANAVYTDTASEDEQFNLTDLPSGAFHIKAVVVSARVTSTVGATADKVALGFRSGGSVAVGTSQSTTTAWETKEEIFAQNPVTSADWVQSDMNALQVDLQSDS